PTTASPQPELLPPLRHASLGRLVHADFFGPVAGEAFGGPFARGVYTHFRSIIWQPRGVVERIDGAEGELDVALGVDVVQHFQRDLADVLHIDVFIDHENAFRRHRLSERPDGVHYLARLAGVGVSDRHDHQVVEDALDGQVDVDELGDGEAHKRQKDALDRLAHVGVFHGRLTDDGGRVDWVLAMRDAGDVEDGIEVFGGVKAGVVPKGAFHAELVELDVAFEHNL